MLKWSEKEFDDGLTKSRLERGERGEGPAHEHEGSPAIFLEMTAFVRALSVYHFFWGALGPRARHFSTYVEKKKAKPARVALRSELFSIVL